MTGDIITRLRTWVHAVDAVPVSDLMDEAADEIARRQLTAGEDEALANACMLCTESARRARAAGHASLLCDQFDGFARTLRALRDRMRRLDGDAQ